MARGRSTGRRTDYTWVGTFADLGSLAGTALVSPIAIINQAATVMRVRGRLALNLITSTTVGVLRMAAGIIIADDDAVAAGTSSIPNPVTDLDAEWLWNGALYISTMSTTLSENAGANVIDRIEVDTKSMRRVKQNEQVVLAIQPTQLTGTVVGEGFSNLRVLFGA